MSAFQRMIQALQGGGVDPRVQGAIVSWLRGEDLMDPNAVGWLQQFYPDLAAAGKDAPSPTGAVKVQMQRVPGAPGGGAQGGARDNQPGVGQPAPASPSPLGIGLAGGAASARLSPTVAGGGDAPPVRGVPQGGGPAAAVAAQAGNQAGLAAQWMAGRGRSGSAPPMNPVPTPSAAPTQQMPQTGGGGGSSMSGVIPGGGGISDAQGLALGPGGDNDFRMRQALRAAGIDGNSRGLRTQYLKQVLAKAMAARGEMLGLEGGGADPTSYLDTLKNTVLSFITPGRSGSSEQRALGQQIGGGQAFQSALANADDTNAQAQMYQNLLQMQYGFENPAIQSGAQNVFQDTMNNYQDDQIMGDKPFEGLFSQYAQRDPKSTIARILGGLYGR